VNQMPTSSEPSSPRPLVRATIAGGPLNAVGGGEGTAVVGDAEVEGAAEEGAAASPTGTEGAGAGESAAGSPPAQAAATIESDATATSMRRSAPGCVGDERLVLSSVRLLPLRN